MRHRAAAIFGLLVVSVLLFSASPRAEEDFSWRQCAGQSLRVVFSRHPFAEAVRQRLGDFERLTGVKVVFAMAPEERYLSFLDRALKNGRYSPDVYMTGVDHVWKHVPEGRMEPLDGYINNPSKTQALYRPDDFFPSLVDAFRWNRAFGSGLGQGTLWALPIGFEAGALTYNREILARHRILPPSSMEDLLAAGVRLRGFENRESYGVAARGAGDWHTFHSGYIAVFTAYGGRDMEVEDGRLVSRVNSPEAVAITDMWVRLIRECGPDDWEYSTRRRCLDDIGRRQAAMLLDADVLGHHANAAGVSSQSGKLGMAPPPIPPGVDPDLVESDLWAWGLAINPGSDRRDAAWLFLQYFTNRDFQMFSVLEWTLINPSRRSVFEDPAFRAKIAAMEGYAETMAHIIDRAAIRFTPNPHAREIAERWAGVIRDIAGGIYPSTQEGMDSLKEWMDHRLEDVRVD